MKLTPRQELVKLQKRLYRRNKALIADSVEVSEPDFHNYEARYQRAVAKYEKTVRTSTMLRAVENAEIVYVGDYHTCTQSQRSFLRLLKHLVQQKNRPLLIALELINQDKQKYLDAFMAGRLSERNFLDKAGLKEHWVFDLWENFRPIFDFARHHMIPIYGVESARKNSNLQQRDDETGKLVAKLSSIYPDRQVLVLIGDLHLAPQHLPLSTRSALDDLGIERKDLTLYQNSDSIYWELAEKGREHSVAAVKINQNSFCRMNTPPIVCQQSYLNWLDHEEGEIDYADAKHQFIELVDQISKFLKIKIEKKDREHVTVYTCGDFGFLQQLRRKKAFSKSVLDEIKSHVLKNESYFIPEYRIVYLASLSLNHAAEEASHYLKFILCGLESPREITDAFFANVLHEALGFFGSKLVNHRRKCTHEGELKSMQQYFKKNGVPEGRETESSMADLILRYKEYERKGRLLAFDKIFHQPPELFFAITHALGYMLGDRLFYAVMSHKLTRSTICKVFRDPWENEGDAFATYSHLLQRVSKIKIPDRM